MHENIPAASELKYRNSFKRSFVRGLVFIFDFRELYVSILVKLVIYVGMSHADAFGCASQR